MSAPKKADAVFEGGGVKGIGLVGALAVAEQQGYTFENVAGTSAGAIVASLVAAGYSAAELKDILDHLDYSKFKDDTPLDHVPVLGKGLELVVGKGMYAGRFFENWLRALLAKKNVHTFKDLILPAYQNQPKYRYKLQAIASDISRGKLLVLPGDIADYGVNPDDLEVAAAVRMSMSIPFFFVPVWRKDPQGQTCYIVDGGVLSNYPVWLFDDGTPNPPWPTLGFKLISPTEQQARTHTIVDLITLFAALFETMMEAHDARHVEDANFTRSIPIPTLGVRTTDFNLSPQTAEALYQSGVQAAQKFFGGWDFERYKRLYRQAGGSSGAAKVAGKTNP